MSEWKSRLVDETIDSPYNDFYCSSGWSITDGFIDCVKAIKKRFQRRKLKKTQIKTSQGVDH